MNPTDTPKSDRKPDQTHDKIDGLEGLGHRPAPEKRPADPELADIEDLHKIEKQQDS